VNGMWGRHLLLFTWSVWVTSAVVVSAAANRESDAKRLYDDKLKKSGYSKLIRPVGNTSDSLLVEVGLRLTSIIDVVSKQVGLLFVVDAAVQTRDFF
jgi:hypothetical protein